MKVLVATADGQGLRVSDFNWCFEGELVRLGPVCAIDMLDADGGCGCGRAFSGLDSGRATTTARVADLALDLPAYAAAIRSSLHRQGWRDMECAAEAAELTRVVADWPLGTIVERRLDELRVRPRRG